MTATPPERADAAAAGAGPDARNPAARKGSAWRDVARRRDAATAAAGPHPVARDGATAGPHGERHALAAGDGATAGPHAERHALAAAMHEHWWYRGRRAAVAALLQRARVPRGGLVLDYGCGTGHMGRTLSRFGEVYGLDLEATPLDLGAFPDYAWVGSGRLEEFGLPPATFDLIACLDVLEHVDDDTGLLRDLAALLAPDGRIVASVPLRPELFCEMDVLAGHVRRYTPANFAALAVRAGLHVQAATGYVVAALPLAVVQRRRIAAGRARPTDELAVPPAALNALLSLLAIGEGRLARYVSLPPGLSLISVLKRAAR